MDTPVILEISTILKEKGYNKPCTHYYYNNILDSSVADNWNDLNGCSAPTISEVVMWLYDNYKIWISVEVDINGFFNYYVTKYNPTDKAWEIKETSLMNKTDKTPTGGYFGAILFAIKNLI